MAPRTSPAAAKAAAPATHAPVSNVRVYNPELIHEFKVRAAEQDRYLKDCWEEAIRDWLAKGNYVSPNSKRDKSSPQHVFGLRVDERLMHRLKVQATKLGRSNGDCLEEATEDWLRKHRTRRKGV